jgi:MFS superfamily sulfate permease-like transporter
MRAPGLPALADWGAGLSIAGLLLPEAVAYSGIAGLPPQAGVIALFAGLLAYGLLGTSRFAIVSATSSSAAVLLAATASMAGTSPQQRMLLAVGIVLLTGLFFVVAGLARLGAVSNFIAKPVLRGFALGLALTIVVKQIPHAVAFQPVHGDLPRFAWELVSGWRHWNAAGLAMAVAALLLMRALARWRGLGELAFAMALILYAESYGSIRTFALRHGDRVDANRDLMALGAANLLSGVFHGMPVGAGYSATSANEVAGAQSRAAGLVACAVVGLAVWLLLPWIESTPEPLLAAIVIHAVGHTLNPAALRPYFAWRRDRLIVVLAFVAVLALGVLDGLLLAIAASLLMLLQTLSRSHVSWLGRLADTHDFVDVARHPDAVVPAGLLIARPEAPLFFGNADPVFAAIRERLRTLGSPTGVVLSLEDSADLDATSVEALCDFAVRLHQDGVPLVLARVKDPVRDLLARVASPALPPACYAGWSVDDAVRQLQAV